MSERLELREGDKLPEHSLTPGVWPIVLGTPAFTRKRLADLEAKELRQLELARFKEPT